MVNHDLLWLICETGVSSLALDKIISKNYDCSYYYANEIIKGKFELGELAISRICHYSYCYAFYILKGRFRLGELAIVKSLNFNYLIAYVINTLKYNHE